MQSWLQQFSWLAPEITVAVVVVLAFFSGRLSIVLGTLVLAVAAIGLLVAPAKTAEIVALSFYATSLIIAVSGLVARQKTKNLQREFDRLRKEVNRLSIAAERVFVKELNEEQDRIRRVQLVRSKT